MAGTLNGFLDHTQSSRTWFHYYINDVRHGEIGQVAAIAGHYGVSLIMVSGDAAACAEAEALVPGVRTAAVKWGMGRQQARCLHPEKARELIRQAAKEAVAAPTKPAPYEIALPGTIRLEVCRTDLADSLARKPGTRRLDARTVERSIESALEVLAF
jgi:D-amino peptidase